MTIVSFKSVILNPITIFFMMKQPKSFIGFVAVITFFAAIVTSCHRKPVYITESGMVWNTIYKTTYSAHESLNDSVKATMRRVELSLSPFNARSLISQINAGVTDSTDELIDTVFAVSQMINRESGGVFDPSAAPLFSLWGVGHGDKNGGTPTDEQIDSALQSVGIGDCSIDRGVIMRKSVKTQFNFSAITKGYGCDMVGECLRRNGCDNYMVEIGGEITLAGLSPSGEKWRIQVDAPIFNDSTVEHSRLGIIKVTDCGIATSGNYRNFRRDESGNIYGHTISPVTGRPVTDIATLSATVIAQNCMTADALATACMAMSPTDALAMIERIEGADVMLVSSDGNGGYRLDVTTGFPTIIK